MGSKNPKLRNKPGGTKSKDMPKGSAKTTAKVMRAARAVATGGKSEIVPAMKRLAKYGGGYSTNKKRKMYKHGGVAHGNEAMPKAKPC